LLCQSGGANAKKCKLDECFQRTQSTTTTIAADTIHRSNQHENQNKVDANQFWQDR
jgi:hypothetical protein